MPPLGAVVYEHWLAAQRDPVKALAFDVSRSHCVLLQAYREEITSHHNLPARANFLIVFKSTSAFTLNVELIDIVRQHSNPMVVVMVSQTSALFRAVGWYVSSIDLETVDLCSDLAFLAQATSGEAYAVILASVVALALLVIIAVSLLPAAPALT